MTHLANTVAEVPPDACPCVFHSHATYQQTDEWRERFTHELEEIGRTRDIAHVSVEWLRDDPGPQLHVTSWREGVATRRHLADCHHHGAWLRWLEDAS